MHKGLTSFVCFFANNQWHVFVCNPFLYQIIPIFKYFNIYLRVIRRITPQCTYLLNFHSDFFPCQIFFGHTSF